MNRHIASLMIIVSILFYCIPVNAAKVDAVENEWTFFVYICGSDLESGGTNGYAGDNISEMINGSSGTDIRFVVEAGGSNCQNSYFSNDETRRYVIEDGQIDQVGKDTLMDMGEGDTLKEFLKWGTTSYPAEHMAVVIWDHGGGAMLGCCWDEIYYGSSMSLKEINDAFAGVSAGMDKKFDIIAFDCCSMGCIELAEILVPYGDYFIASEELIPATGYNYETLAEYIIENPDCDPVDVGTVLCETYISESEELYEEFDLSLTISMTDLSAVEDFDNAFDEFCSGLGDPSQDDDEYNYFLTNLSGGSDFDSGVYDLYTFTNAFADHLSGADEVNSAIDDMIVYAYGEDDDGDYCGLSVFVPIHSLTDEEVETFSYICPSEDLEQYTLSFPWI